MRVREACGNGNIGQGVQTVSCIYVIEPPQNQLELELSTISMSVSLLESEKRGRGFLRGIK